MTRTIAVLAVHGIGLQTRGSTLRGVGQPLADALTTVVTSRGGHCEVVEASRLGDAARSEQFRLALTLGGEERHVVVAESWWAETFQPARYRSMMGWSVRAAGRAGRRIAASTRSGADTAADELHARVRLLDELRDRTLAGVPPWSRWIVARGFDSVRRTALRLARLSELLVRLAAGAAIVGVVVTVLLVPVLLVALLALGLWKATRSAAATARSGLAAALGDAFVFERHSVDQAAMVSQVRADLAALRADGVDEIVLVAHSLGAAVSYRALLHADARERVSLFVTVGNGIRAVRADADADGDLAGPLGGLEWLDLHTSFDPVPAGPLPFAPPADDAEPTATSMRVANHQSPVMDHTAYFRNTEQVIARIAARVLGHAFAPPPPLHAAARAAATAPNSAVSVEDAWEDPTVLVHRFADRVRVAAVVRTDRKNLMTPLMVAFLVGVVAVGAALGDRVASLGSWTLVRGAGLLERVPDVLEPGPTVAGWLVVGAIGMALLLGGLAPLYGWWDRRVGRRALGTDAALHRHTDLLVAAVAFVPGIAALVLAPTGPGTTSGAGLLAIGAVALASVSLLVGHLTMRSHDLVPAGLLTTVTDVLRRETQDLVAPTAPNDPTPALP